MKSLIYLLSAVLAFNLGSQFLVLSQAQQSANSHVNMGPMLGTLYFILACGCALLAAVSLFRYRAYYRAALFLLLNGSLIFWGFRLLTLYCEGCALSG